MTTPSPRPQSTPNPQDSAANGVLGQLGNLDQQVAALGSQSSADKYGLGQWGQSKVDVGNLFGLGAGTNGQFMTLDDVMQHFLQLAVSPSDADRQLAAAIQLALYQAGYYGTKTPTLGLVNNTDISAFTGALKQAAMTQGATNVDGQGNPYMIDLGSFLKGQATVGQANGQGAAQQVGVAELQLPNPADLERVAQDAFQRTTGKKGTPAQVQAFTTAYLSSYQQQQAANARAKFDAQVAAAQTRTQPQQPQPQQQPAAPEPSFAASKQGMLDRQDQTQGALGPAMDNGAGFVNDVGQLQQTQAPPAPVLDTYTTTSPESEQVAAENYARSTDPQGAAVHDLGGQLANFWQILTGSFGGQ